MTTNETGVICTRVKLTEKQAIERAASERNIAPAALIYAALHQLTNGFTSFESIPDKMPRSHMVRVSNEVTE